jgi:hydroxypyruvate isomerase
MSKIASPPLRFAANLSFLFTEHRFLERFAAVFDHLRRIGYGGWVAAEYKPSGRSEDSLGWMQW